MPWDTGINATYLRQAIAPPRTTTWHHLLVATANELGYTNLESGLCQGFSSTGPTAFWVSILGFHEDGIKSYLDRLLLLKSEPVNELKGNHGVHGFFSRIELIHGSQSYKDYHDSLIDSQSRNLTQAEKVSQLEAIIKPSILKKIIPENPWRLDMEAGLPHYEIGKSD